MYKVIKNFIDLQDANHEYRAGDVFPRSNLKVSAERLKELSTERNRRNQPLIKEIPDEVKSEPVKKLAKKVKSDAE
jgi:hypothetical protein